MPDTIQIVSFENQEFKFDLKFNVIVTRTVCSCLNRLFTLKKELVKLMKLQFGLLGSLMEGCSVVQAKYIFSLVLRTFKFWMNFSFRLN